MKNLFYISLDKTVVEKQLGGYSHIKGVIEGLKGHYKLKVGAWCTNLLGKKSDDVEYVEISHSKYYLNIFKILIQDKEADVFLFRKNLIGMYIVSLAFLLKRLLGSKQKYYFEFNAISGDYQVENKLKSTILYWSNIFPVILSSGVYCVTQSVFDRLAKNSLISNKKLVLCPNGGPPPLFQDLENVTDDKLCIYYYGSHMPYYHIDYLVNSIKKIQNDHEKAIELHLIGPNMEHLKEANVYVHGAMGIESFQSLIMNIKGTSWGIVPLDKFDAGSSIDPIKTFDYLSLGMPVLHSKECLSLFDTQGHYSEKYEIDNLVGSLIKIREMSQKDYSKVYNTLIENYYLYQWEARLENLRVLIGVK